MTRPERVKRVCVRPRSDYPRRGFVGGLSAVIVIAVAVAVAVAVAHAVRAR